MPPLSPVDDAAADDLVAAILRGDPAASRNRNFELMTSELGRRARRRAAFLRSVARDLEALRRAAGASVTIERGSFARHRVRVVIRREDLTRRAYLTEPEVALLAQHFPLAARLFDVNAAGAE